MAPSGRLLWNAIWLPSGDQFGRCASNSVNVSWRTSPPFVSIVKMLKYLVLLSRVLEKTILRPSGDQFGSTSGPGLFVSCRSPVPSALIVQISRLYPPRFGLWGRRLNAILRPSGDQVGFMSSPRLNVSCATCEPSAFMTKTSVSPSGFVSVTRSLVNAILRPSADHFGSNSAPGESPVRLVWSTPLGLIVQMSGALLKSTGRLANAIFPLLPGNAACAEGTPSARPTTHTANTKRTTRRMRVPPSRADPTG